MVWAAEQRCTGAACWAVCGISFTRIQLAGTALQGSPSHVSGTHASHLHSLQVGDIELWDCLGPSAHSHHLPRLRVRPHQHLAQVSVDRLHQLIVRAGLHA